VPPDPQLMRAIATRTGGRTYPAATAVELANVFANLGSSIGRQTKSREVTSWFALAAAGFVLAAVAAGRVTAGALS
jgi:hypothetical protein